MMAKIFIAGRVPESTKKFLQDFNISEYSEDGVIKEEELMESVRDVDAILCPLSTPLSKKVMEQAKNVKIIANFGAGFDNIDVEAAKKHGIIVTNTPGVSTEATAELSIGLMIAVARRIVEGDQFSRTKEFKGWSPLFFLGTELYGKTLGIVGLGNIGQAVARRAKAFGMNIIYTGPSQKPNSIEQKYGATYVRMDELLQTSDVISLHLPYKREVHHLFSQEAFQQMKPNAILVNAARGPIVDEKALINAIKKKEIRGAALDVYEFEPLITEELKLMKEVVITPHIGNATIETRDAMGEIAAKNIISVLNGKQPLNPIY